MIAHAGDVRDSFNIFRQLAKQFFLIHLSQKNSFPRPDLRIAMRLHGKMENDLPSLSVSLFSKCLRKRGKRKNGKSDGKIPMKKFLRNVDRRSAISYKGSGGTL